jgi:glycosyltransferase involved in cell wall biosynthesis
MKTRIFLPSVKKPTGGITVLRQVADILHRAGHDARLVARDRSGWRPERLADSAPVIEWKDLDLERDDLWLVPEGWVNGLTPGLEARAACLSYVQNWAYLFSALPEGVLWNQLPVRFLAVSDPVAEFISQTLDREAPVLGPGIDRTVFYAPEQPGSDRITVAYMPRKNKADAHQIRAIFEHRKGPDKVRWRPLERLSATGVAEALRTSHVFLSTGYPEGFSLPPLEAMACGCLPVGFSGLGGWDYMRQAKESPRFAPWFPLREVPWTGNGLWCADGDVLDAALCLEEAVAMLQNPGPALDAVLKAGQETADAYSTKQQEAAVLALWETL